MSETQLTENVTAAIRMLVAVKTNPMFRIDPDTLKTKNGYAIQYVSARPAITKVMKKMAKVLLLGKAKTISSFP